jgi:hypothetical protein
MALATGGGAAAHPEKGSRRRKEKARVKEI